jgi:hypothetical protein
MNIELGVRTSARNTRRGSTKNKPSPVYHEIEGVLAIQERDEKLQPEI